MVNHCLIAVGSNLPLPAGGVQASLTVALRLLNGHSIRIDSQSRFFRTPAFPAGAGPDYVNAAIRISTPLAPAKVIEVLHEVEASMGRTRDVRWGPRLIDLDLLACGAAILPDESGFAYWQNLSLARQKIETPDRLILPHPRLHERAFVLVPLMDIAPDWVHPVLNESVRVMVAKLSAQAVAEIVPLG